MYLYLAHCPLRALEEIATLPPFMEEKTDPQKNEKELLKGIYSTMDSGLVSRRAREML